MSKKSNPFHILGLNPDVLKGLNNETILNLVSKQARLLQVIFHPDNQVSGNEAKFKKVTEAINLLKTEDDWQTFIYYKKKFMAKKPVQKKIQELDSDLAMTRTFSYKLYEYIIEFIESFAGFHEDKLTISNCLTISLVMHNTIANVNLPLYEKTKHPKSKDKPKDINFILAINEAGIISKISSELTKEYPQKMLIGTIPSNVILDDFAGVSNFLETVGIAHREKKSSRKKLATSDLPPPDLQANAKIESANFITIMPWLTTTIEENHYLFSINRIGQETFFELEGKIIRIDIT
jgi:hypothetical protein